MTTLSELGLACHAQGNGTVLLYGRQVPANVQALIPASYIGGMLSTEQRFTCTFGIFDVRARFSPTQGHHWTIRLMQAGAAAAAPFIKIGEMVNAGGSVGDRWSDGTRWTDGTGWESGSGRIYHGAAGAHGALLPWGGAAAVDSDRVAWSPDAYTDWHTYRFVWTPEVMEWWADGVLRLSMANYLVSPMFLAIIPEISDDLSGPPDGSTRWPMTGEIDYVRIYSPPEHVLPTAIVGGGANLRDSGNASPPTRLTDLAEPATLTEPAWWTAAAPPSIVDVRVRFATPTRSPVGEQRIRVRARLPSGAGSPIVSVQLWQNGAKKTSEVAATLVSPAGQMFDLPFYASELAGFANVEARILTTGGGADIGAVDWLAISDMISTPAAAILTANSVSADLSAAIRASRSASAGLDARIGSSTVGNATLGLSAAILAARSASAGLDASIGAVPSYAPNGIVFPGTAYLTLAGQFTGAVDSVKFSAAFAVKFTGTASDQHVLAFAQSSDNNYPALVIGRDGSNYLYIYGANVTTTNITFQSNTPLTVGQWYRVLLAFDGAGGTASIRLWIEDVSNLAAAGQVCNNVARDFTSSAVRVGAKAGSVANVFNGEMADLWFDIGRVVDWATVGNRRLFFNAAGALVDKGTDGHLPFNAVPTGFFSGPTAAWPTNKGAGGGMTLTGTLTTSASPPAGA